MPINSGFHVIWTDEFLAEHQLPSHYLTIAQPWLVPVIDQIASQQQGQPRTLLVGLNGCQGSGKSTLGSLDGGDAQATVWTHGARGLSGRFLSHQS